MRNMKKTIPALLLALGLALSMTACGNKESETVTPDNSTTPEAVETQPTQEATGTEETTSRDDTGVYPINRSDRSSYGCDRRYLYI